MDGLNILGKINRLGPFYYVYNAIDNNYKSTSLLTSVFAALFTFVCQIFQKPLLIFGVKLVRMGRGLSFSGLISKYESRASCFTG